MGFIDRLRSELERQKVAEDKKKADEAELIYSTHQSEQQKLQNEGKQRSQAVRFYDESKVEEQLKNFTGVVKGEYVPLDGLKWISLLGSIEYRMAEVRWNEKVIDHRSNYEAEWDKLQADAFKVHCSPAGIIRFRAGLFSGSSVPRTNWLNNAQVFDEALERAYRGPSKVVYTGNIKRVYYWGGD